MPKSYLDKLRDRYEASRDATERARLTAVIENLLLKRSVVSPYHGGLIPKRIGVDKE